MLTMQGKTPHNKQGQAHGLWEVTFHQGGGYVCHYINGLEYGLDDIVWTTGEIEKLYYAR